MRDILMAFEEDVGAALAKACELDSDSDAVHLAHAAQIVRRHMFGEAIPSQDSLKDVKKNLCHRCCFKLVGMILEGPS